MIESKISKTVLGIEASNILAGGGLVHLKELLTHAHPSDHGFDKVILWAPQSTLDQLPDKPWLIKETHGLLNKNILFRMVWLFFVYPQGLKRKVDVVFSPGASLVFFPKVVTMCQNLLPFDSPERKLYAWSAMRIRLKLLNYIQSFVFKNAQGIIFLTPSSVKYVYGQKVPVLSKVKVIPHGVLPCFYQRTSAKNSKATIKVLYVSIIDVYKHQWNVVEAIYNLLDKGCNIELTLVGNQYKPAAERLQKTVASRPEYKDRITCSPVVPYEELNEIYHQSDIFVFASSCETFSLILLEAMASGLPIACADKDTLVDTLGDAGVYFDPYDPLSIEKALSCLIDDPLVRKEKEIKAKERAKEYSWTRCADQTFSYLSRVVNQ